MSEEVVAYRTNEDTTQPLGKSGDQNIGGKASSGEREEHHGSKSTDHAPAFPSRDSNALENSREGEKWVEGGPSFFSRDCRPTLENDEAQGATTKTTSTEQETEAKVSNGCETEDQHVGEREGEPSGPSGGEGLSEQQPLSEEEPIVEAPGQYETEEERLATGQIAQEAQEAARRAKEEAEAHAREEQERLENASATTIQSAWRGLKARRAFKPIWDRRYISRAKTSSASRLRKITRARGPARRRPTRGHHKRITSKAIEEPEERDAKVIQTGGGPAVLAFDPSKVILKARPRSNSCIAAGSPRSRSRSLGATPLVRPFVPSRGVLQKTSLPSSGLQIVSKQTPVDEKQQATASSASPLSTPTKGSDAAATTPSVPPPPIPKREAAVLRPVCPREEATQQRWAPGGADITAPSVPEREPLGASLAGVAPSLLSPTAPPPMPPREEGDPQQNCSSALPSEAPPPMPPREQKQQLGGRAYQFVPAPKTMDMSMLVSHRKVMGANSSSAVAQPVSSTRHTDDYDSQHYCHHKEQTEEEYRCSSGESETGKYWKEQALETSERGGSNGAEKQQGQRKAAETLPEIRLPKGVPEEAAPVGDRAVLLASIRYTRGSKPSTLPPLPPRDYLEQDSLLKTAATHNSAGAQSEWSPSSAAPKLNPGTASPVPRRKGSYMLRKLGGSGSKKKGSGHKKRKKKFGSKIKMPGSRKASGRGVAPASTLRGEPQEEEEEEGASFGAGPVRATPGKTKKRLSMSFGSLTPGQQLQRAIDQSPSDPSQAISPRYLPTKDEQARSCLRCSIQLKKRNKRNCKGCGNAFCKKCTSKKIRLPHLGYGQKKVEVCESCFAAFFMA